MDKYLEENKESLLSYWDMLNVMKTKYEEGVEQGIEQGIEKGIERIAIRCLKQGKSTEEVAAITGLSKKQIQTILGKLNK